MSGKKTMCGHVPADSSSLVTVLFLFISFVIRFSGALAGLSKAIAHNRGTSGRRTPSGQVFFSQQALSVPDVACNWKPVQGSRQFNANPHPALWPLLLAGAFVLASCGTSTETVVVDRQARTIEVEEDEIVEDTSVRVLKLGEVNPIRSFDPLFAENSATMRVVMLAYEGLVRFNENDDIVPAAARGWEISSDSLRYTFHLRNDLFFHDDESFTQGRGRRVTSRDVVRVFERMASRDVPTHGAELFMNTIRGFETYFLEQHELFFDADRKVDRITGIETSGNATVIFHLAETDPHFLEKLASPYAVLYPSEPFRFRDEGLHRHAVGTGPFRFESSVGDSIHIFLRNTTYSGAGQQDRRIPNVHRLELLNVSDETRLYSHFTRNRIDVIPELGLLSIHTLVDDNNELFEELRSLYRIEARPDPNPVVVRYNAANRFGLDHADAAAILRHVNTDTLQSALRNPTLRVTYKQEEFSQTNIGRVFRRFGNEGDRRMLFAFNQDNRPRLITSQLVGLVDDNLNVDLIQRRVFSRDTFLYTDYLTTFIPGVEHAPRPQEVLRLESDRYLLSNQRIEGIRTNSLSWWIDLAHVRVRDIDTP
ncbi:ABC transporter substrate-binding protein [Balneolales bacterium ANBcel1]|nr:ABC transporter substrate-binding protein [Balneolales bacterium ANBcel1]